MMERMPQNQHEPSATPGGGDAPAVVEWGSDAPARRPGRPGAAGRGRDRRLVMAIAGLGALALFASLISEWQSTTISANLFGPSDDAGNREVFSSVGDLDAWGGGYLAGLVPLVATTAVLLFGPPASAQLMRVLSLSSAGVLLAVLTGLAVDLGNRSMALGNLVYVAEADAAQRVALGRGVTCAFVGVAALGLAAYLSRRPGVVRPAGTPGADPSGAASPGGGGRVGGTATPGADGRTGAEDLTVEATAPFTAEPDGPR